MEELAPFAGHGVDVLLQWITTRGLPFGFERSGRISRSGLCTQRCLLSFALQHNSDSEIPAIVAICSAMKAPQRFCQAIGRFARNAAFVHFGFESGAPGHVGKCYLELAPAVPEGPATNEARLQFLGYKWSTTDASVGVVTRYSLVPALSWNAVEERLASQLNSPTRDAVMRLAERIRQLDQTSGPPAVLEITEEGSDRRSCDINLYPLELRVGQVSAEISTVSSTIVPGDIKCSAWLEEIGKEELGHLATGIDRHGHPFLTVYFGMQQIQLTS